MTDAEAVAILDLLPEEHRDSALALVLAAFAEQRREHGDLNAINRVRDLALSICQTRRVAE